MPDPSPGRGGLTGLVAAGQRVFGPDRSDAGAKAVSAAGGDVLRQGAAAAEGVIHLAFIHDFTKFRENCAICGRAIEALAPRSPDSRRTS